MQHQSLKDCMAPDLYDQQLYSFAHRLTQQWHHLRMYFGTKHICIAPKSQSVPKSI